MPDQRLNHPLLDMWQERGKTLNSFGKDSTGTIDYVFNAQGFRSSKNYDFVPDHAFFGCSLVFGVGVPEDKIFASWFESSQNYGLAGTYNNQHILQTICNFVDSTLYSPNVKMAVFWSNRDSEQLESYYQQLKSHKLVHVFCGKPLPYQQCYPMIKNLDWDVSQTHIGEKTHEFVYKFLCRAFNQ